ncbi:hypothetical protein RJ639_024548, partial [Escallonia herrerae]
WHSLDINCGGRETSVDGNIKYEDDTDSSGPSRLHFAEIMFSDDNLYSSLGRRIFDVYIQGKLEPKDFNIADEAGGVGKEIIKQFTVVVSKSTLEIRFYWAGKGTTGIPVRGVYGPLISAISLDSDFVPPSENRNSISVGTVVGIVVAVVFVTFFVLGIFWWRGSLRRKDRMELVFKYSVETVVCILQYYLDMVLFLLTTLNRSERSRFTNWFIHFKSNFATNNFDAANKIREGGLVLSTSGYMAPEYAMRGYLTDKADVYSFGVFALEIVSGRSNMSYRSKEDMFNLLGWVISVSFMHLFYLISFTSINQPHFLFQRISYFLFPCPVLLLCFFCVFEGSCLKRERGLMELVDPRLGSEYDKEEVMAMINVALLCTKISPAVRPAMSSVVSMLEGEAVVPEFVSEANSVSSDNIAKQQEMKPRHNDSHVTTTSMGDGQIHGMSIDGPFTASSTSTGDLYPVEVNTEYWENR